MNKVSRYVEVTFFATRAQFQEFVAQTNCLATWVKDSEAESRMEEMGSSDDETKYLAFRPSSTNSTLPVLAWLIYDGTLVRLANIVPTASNSMTQDEYNKVATLLYHQLVEPVCKKLGLDATVSKTAYDLSELLSDEALKRLTTFSSAANKSTGRAHPSDEARWMEFIWQAHIDDCALSATQLGEWLTQQAKWPEENASELASEYEFARSLLRFAENRG